jgi:SPP1 gp7 family putative phage head morphogenesis protein
MPEFNFVLGLPPAKVIEWLQAKGVTTQNYRQLTASEIAKVYTIARISDLDMLQTIKAEMVKSAQTGTAFDGFKRELLDKMQQAGWLHPDGNGGREIIDPESGEVFGAPRRLETIYRTNMQAAYNAGQYQTYMDNVDNRPYWQYSAVGDERTRPAHQAMAGLVYRYDDPFWATFYPPNGYNCRCTVIAYAQRDVARRGLLVSQSSAQNFVEVNKIYNKKGDSYPTRAYKAPDGTLVTTDRGFDYNAGRMNYRPNLDQYDKGLARAFARTEMTGPEFSSSLKRLETEFYTVKSRLGIEGKPTPEQKITIRNTLSRNLKFAGGVLSDADQAGMKLPRATVWLSDDTLIKQVDSRAGQAFDAAYYARLPDVLGSPDRIFKDGRNFTLIKYDEEKVLLAVIKQIEHGEELFLQSYRISNSKEAEKLTQKLEILK